MQLVKVDALAGSVGFFQCLGQGGGGGRHAQHTAAVGNQLALLDGGARMVDGHVGGIQLALGQAGDLLALLVGEGIAAAGQNDTGGSAVAELDLGLIQRAVGGSLHHGQQVAFQQGQHHLGLRVAKAAVVLDDLGAVGGQHQAKVKAALKGAALGLHGGHGRQEDLLHAAVGHGGGVVGVGGHGAHAAGVQAFVMVQRTLVVHAGDHRLDGLSIAEGQHADLGTGEKLLDHHMIARCTELFIQHDLFHAVGGFLLVLADQHALAQGQAVGLDDHGILALGTDVRHDLGRVVEGLVLGGGDTVFLHQVLAEYLAGLDAGRGFVGAKGRDADRRQGVDHAQGQGVILGNDYIVKGFLFGKGDHGVHVGGGDGLAVGIVADAAVAGCAPDLGAEGAFFQCADNGVLAPAAAYNQNFHKRPP